MKQLSVRSFVVASRASAVRSAVALLVLLMGPAAVAHAADLHVPAGGNLQAAIDAAAPGDTIVLEAGATYAGNFTLRNHGGTQYITIRTQPSEQLPADGVRITPAHAPYLAKIKSPNTASAMRTRAGAGYWRLQLLEFQANVYGESDILALGDGSSKQNTLASVPHHLIVDQVYMHGDPQHGQKRGIALNSADTTIVNSWIVEMKALSQDAQAIAGWNGPGPFRIENNHLEAAAEVFLMGGDDPKIPNLTPSDLVFRGNTLTRPVSWRDPILATPAGVRASSAAGGALPTGTYAYRIVARQRAGGATAKSAASPEVVVTAPANARITITWDAVPDAADYLVYGRTAGAQNQYWIVTTPGFTDDGLQAGKEGTPSSKGSVWQVKNLFELKHMRRAVVADNLMENNWAQAQQGTAVLITPRNQGGTCTWCQVADVTFEYNTVRSTGSALKILGWDDEHPSRQTTNITVRHNLFDDVSKQWGGTGVAFILIGEPKQVTIDHNTVISPDGGAVLIVDQAPVQGLTLTNNVARHNNYGIQGGGKGVGNTAIAYYFPDGLVTRNVLAGGKASSYPAGNEFPAVAEFEKHFVDYAGGDFSLVPGTNWERAGTDGLDLGADMAAAAAREREVPPQILTTVLPAAIESRTYHAALEAKGGRAPYAWSISSGFLPEGVSLDGTTGTLSGVARRAGDYRFTVRVKDAAGAIGTQPLSVQVGAAANRTPSVSLTAPRNGATVPVGATITLAAQAADTDGIVQRVDFYVGDTKVGSAAGPLFTLPWTVPTAGSYTFKAVAVDDRGATATSAAVKVSTTLEIVLRGSQATQLVGNFMLEADASAAGGYSLWNVNRGLTKVTTAVAKPAHYAEFTFFAEAGRPYRLWIRGKAENNSYANDSVHVQFDHVASAQIGTTSSVVVNLEDGPDAGLSGWGWQDTGYGAGVSGAPIVFSQTGLQTLRLQNREDGLRIDQMVLSPAKFLTMSPGALKNDTTLLPQ